MPPSLFFYGTSGIINVVFFSISYLQFLLQNIHKNVNCIQTISFHFLLPFYEAGFKVHFRRTTEKQNVNI